MAGDIGEVMVSLMRAFSSSVMPGAEVGIIGQIATIPQGIMELTNIMIVLASMSIAIIASKAVGLYG